MPVKQPKVVKKKIVKDNYTASIKVMGKTFTAEGDTILEALGNISPGNVKGTVIVTVTRKDKSVERIVPMAAAARTFNTLGSTREIMLKQLSEMFSGV